MLNRRQFLLGTGSVAVLAALPLGLKRLTESKQWLAGAMDDKQGKHFAAAFDLEGRVFGKTALPERGHGVLNHPHKPGVGLVVGRRPGFFIAEIDFQQGRISQQIKPEIGQHFYGHGVFSPDGKYLITTENRIADGQGLIVLRDSQTYQVVDKFLSGGIGPHEALMMPDGKTLVVANGGILTHPNQPRKKLNLDTMQPNLSYIDLHASTVLDSFVPAHHHLSIRHLAVSQNGQVVGGMQYQGAKTDLHPLAFSHQGETQLSPLYANPTLWRQLNQYTASVCIDDASDTAVISCPRSNLVTYWDMTTLSFKHSQKLKDGAGLAMHRSGVVATSGRGEIMVAQQSLMAFDDIRWDNHLAVITT